MPPKRHHAIPGPPVTYREWQPQGVQVEPRFLRPDAPQVRRDVRKRLLLEGQAPPEPVDCCRELRYLLRLLDTAGERHAIDIDVLVANFERQAVIQCYAGACPAVPYGLRTPRQPLETGTDARRGKDLLECILQQWIRQTRECPFGKAQRSGMPSITCFKDLDIIGHLLGLPLEQLTCGTCHIRRSGDGRLHSGKPALDQRDHTRTNEVPLVPLVRIGQVLPPGETLRPQPALK